MSDFHNRFEDYLTYFVGNMGRRISDVVTAAQVQIVDNVKRHCAAEYRNDDLDASAHAAALDSIVDSALGRLRLRAAAKAVCGIGIMAFLSDRQAGMDIEPIVAAVGLDLDGSRKRMVMRRHARIGLFSKAGAGKIGGGIRRIAGGIVVVHVVMPLYD